MARPGKKVDRSIRAGVPAATKLDIVKKDNVKKSGMFYISMLFIDI